MEGLFGGVQKRMYFHFDPPQDLPRGLPLQRKPWRVARHEGVKRIIGQALASTPGTRVRVEPHGHLTSRRHDIQVINLLGSQATGLANAEYDLTVVSLASKDSRTTSLPEQDNNPSRLVNKYLDSVANHKVRRRPSSNLPFHPIVFSLGSMMTAAPRRSLPHGNG
jgi:hypothetical protein